MFLSTAPSELNLGCKLLRIGENIIFIRGGENNGFTLSERILSSELFYPTNSIFIQV